MEREEREREIERERGREGGREGGGESASRVQSGVLLQFIQDRLDRKVPNYSKLGKMRKQASRVMSLLELTHVHL